MKIAVRGCQMAYLFVILWSKVKIFDFQGFVDLDISGGWSQIMSKLDFYSEISTTLPFLQTMTGHRLLHAP